MPVQKLSQGQLIRQWRQRMGWSQSVAANRIGVTRPYLSMLEQNHRKPSKTLLILMDLLEGEIK